MTIKLKSTPLSEGLGPDQSTGEALARPGQEIMWLQDFIRNVDARTDSLLATHPSVSRLKDLIECSSKLRMWASAMFQELPNRIPYNRIDQGEIPRSHVRGYEHMIQLLNVIVAEVAPTWTLSAAGLSLMGLPFQAVLDWPMGTPSGHAFFLDADINDCFKEMLDVWRDNLLKTRKSQSVLTTAPGHWLCPEALAAMELDANLDDSRRYTFEELFDCDPRGDPVHWGFKSWDDFFVRRFRNMDRLRPVGYADLPEWIVSPCESMPLAIKSDVKEFDRFWLKGTPFSVAEMLNHHKWAEEFVGGTVHHSVLKATSYHRWSAPVSGRVVDATVISGTYFSERLEGGFSNEPVTSPPYSTVYMSHVATRALIFIQADDPIGLMCFVAIGIADVSTCDILEKFRANLPRPVVKGEELGMFRYGGSTQCLLFRRGLKLAFAETAVPKRPPRNMAVRSPLALAYI